MISIIVPVFNVELYLKECLESIKKQTYTNLEVIIVDDCSTDNSFNIADNFIKDYKGPIIFKLIKHNKNKGQSAARNTGLGVAKGEYIGFVDSDDYIAPNMYEFLLSEMKSKKVGVVGCDYYQILENNHIINNVFIPIKTKMHISPINYMENIFLRKIHVNVWDKLYSRDTIDIIKFREGKLAEDWFFLCDIAKTIERKNIVSLFIPKHLYYYRFHSKSTCVSNSEQVYIDMLNFIKDFSKEFCIKKPILIKDVKFLYFKNLFSLLNIIANIYNKKHYLYELYHKELFNYKDDDVKNILQPDMYNSYIYMKYFPKEYSIVKNKYFYISKEDFF